MKNSIWRVRLAPLVCAAIFAAACAHAPADRKLDSSNPVAARVPAAPAPPADATGAYPADTVPPAAQTASATTLPSGADTAVGLTQSQYEDLFDRVRAGFALDDIERAAVTAQLNWYIRNPEYLDRAFSRAGLYMYHIVTELEARNMPLELALLPVVESAFEPYAYSRARASGLWQFIPGTGSRFGLKQNWWYDGRRDVVESTRAALDYLQYLHDEFNGDWLLAVAGYNCGEANVARAIRRNQKAGKPTDFWSLPLPKETRAYVPKLLAMKRLVAYPTDFGLEFTTIANQPYFDRVETLGQIDLKLAAEVAGITPEELYELNPAYHRWATDPSGPHYLLLPVEGAAAFRESIGQLTPEQRVGAALYTVKEGDSVSSVAREFHTTIDVIRELNDIPTGVLTVGSALRVPSAANTLPPKVLMAAARVDKPNSARRPRLHVVKRGDSLWRIAQRHGMDVKTLARMNGMSTTDTLRAGQRLRLSAREATADEATPSSGRKVTYTVRRGDTLSQIARLFQVSVAQISSWNGISARNAIKPGQKLTIKVAGRRG